MDISRLAKPRFSTSEYRIPLKVLSEAGEACVTLREDSTWLLLPVPEIIRNTGTALRTFTDVLDGTKP